MAKTAFGHSAGEVRDVIDQLRQQQTGPVASPGPAPAHSPAFAQAPTMLPPPPPAATPPRPAPVPAGYNQPPPPPRPAGAIPAAANAATMFVPGAQPPALAATIMPPQGSPIYGRPRSPSGPPAAGLQAPTMIAPQAVAVQMPSPSAPQPQMPPPMKLPAAQPPPYLAAQTASRAGRPTEPWKDSLRQVMFVGGIGLLAVLATPLQTSPQLVFPWTAILAGDGATRLPPLMLGAIGLLAILIAAIPMQPAARGLLAAVLGVAGIAVPIFLVGLPVWQTQSLLIGLVLLVPGLLIRSEYRDAVLPRVLVTFGAIGVLAPFLVPQSGAIPLVGVFRALLDEPGTRKVIPALAFGMVMVVVMSMLSWLPGPVTGGAKFWAWLLILWGLITQLALVLIAGHLVDAVTHAPNQTLVAWIAGGPSPIGAGLGAAYLVLIGYGLASVLGKQLE
jgi:hypothetical protein